MIIDKVEGSDDLRATTSGPVPSNDLRRRREAILLTGETRTYFPTSKSTGYSVHRNVNHRPRRIQTNAGRCSSSRVRRQLEEYYGGINAVASPVRAASHHRWWWFRSAWLLCSPRTASRRWRGTCARPP